MEIDEQMKKSNESDSDARDAGQVSVPEDRVESVDTSRRRFTRAGLSGSVLMTLASRPAMANHCSVSGAMSGNMSRPAHGVSCAGLAPSDWRETPDEWCSPYSPGTCDSSSDCTDWQNWTGGTELSSLGLSPPANTAQTMMQAMWENPGSLMAHVSAGYLNSCQFGEDAYGYSTTTFPTFINEATSEAELLIDLIALNAPGSRL